MPIDKRANITTGPTSRMVTRSMAIRSMVFSERMTLLNLPKEILYEIIKSIGVEDISEDLKAVTRFAMASKQSLIVAEAAVGSLKELRSLEERFGKPCFGVSSIKRSVAQRCLTSRMFPNLGPQSPASDLAYLNLNGSLSWLSPLDSDTDSDSNDYSDSDIEDHRETYFQEPTIKAGPLKKLITQAERLRLTFPPSFLALVISEDLQRRIPTTTETQFSLGSLVKCSPETDRNAGGYVLKFLSGYEASWTANLYLDTMGQHCVLYSGEDISAEESDEDEDGQEEWTDDAITLQALDFEEYMYHIWINELGWATLFKGQDVSEARRAYLERIQEK